MPKSPILLLLRDEEDEETVDCVVRMDQTDKSVRPLIHSHILESCLVGWLLLLKKLVNSLVLYNPLLDIQIQLPFVSISQKNVV